MKTRILILISFIVVTLCSCNSNEGKVKAAFKDYVQKNFDDPNDLKEIAAVDSCDTINIGKFREPLTKCKLMYDSLRKESMRVNDEIHTDLQSATFKHLLATNESFYKTCMSYNDDYIELLLTDGNVATALTNEFAGGNVKGPDEKYKSILAAKGKTVIQYTIRARVNNNGRTEMHKYYAICDTTFNSIKISKNKAQVKDIMDESVASDIKYVTEEYLNMSLKLNENINQGKQIISYAKLNGM